MTPLPALRRRDTSTVFLETTIQVERFLEAPERRTAIRANLLGKTVCTSSYVLMEFQRTLLQDLQFVRSIIVSSSDTSEDGKVVLHALMAKLRHRSPENSERRVRRTFMVVERLLEIFQGSWIKKSRLLQYLEDQIDDFREEFFEVDLTLEGGGILEVKSSNRTDCDLAKNGNCRCLREEARCSLPEFLSQNAEVIDKVRQAFAEAQRGGDPRMVAAAARIMKNQPIDWEHGKGQKNCWPLSDTIIALESPEDAAIYTTDHHFDVICPIVGRSLFGELPT